MTRAELVLKWEKDGASAEEAIVLIKVIDGTVYENSKLSNFSYIKQINAHLRKYEDDHTAILSTAAPQLKSSADNIPSPTSPAKSIPISLPDEVIFVKLRIRELLKKKSQAHTLLCVENTTAEQRYKLANEIVTVLRPSIDRLYFQKNQWFENQILPDITTSSIIQWANSKHAEKKSITEKLSRLNRSMKKASIEKAVDIQTEIDLLKIQREAIIEDLQLS